MCGDRIGVIPFHDVRAPDEDLPVGSQPHLLPADPASDRPAHPLERIADRDHRRRFGHAVALHHGEPAARPELLDIRIERGSTDNKDPAPPSQDAPDVPRRKRSPEGAPSRTAAVFPLKSSQAPPAVQLSQDRLGKGSEGPGHRQDRERFFPPDELQEPHRLERGGKDRGGSEQDRDEDADRLAEQMGDRNETEQPEREKPPEVPLPPEKAALDPREVD